MQENFYTVGIRRDEKIHKITKLGFSRDGSYMVMMPYHNSNKGFLFKTPVGYSSSLDEPVPIPLDVMLDAGEIDEKRVKLSHHRSGMLQFSGEGIVSGWDENGAPKGIGIRSWSLDNPAPGPSFGIAFIGLDDFKIATNKECEEAEIGTGWILFDSSELAPVQANGFCLEGFYFPPKARRFVKQRNGKLKISIVHPIGITMDLDVALADSNSCEFPGLIGTTLYPTEITMGGAGSGFIVSSSTGNLRKDAKGQIIGDGLYCIFPDGLGQVSRRDLNKAAI